MLWVAQVFRVFTKTTPMVNFRTYTVALLAFPDSLAQRVVPQEPNTKAKPACRLVQPAQFIIVAFCVDSLVVLLKVRWAVAAGLDECWAANLAARTPSFQSHQCSRYFLSFTRA
jgi:hypothetical protein